MNAEIIKASIQRVKNQGKTVSNIYSEAAFHNVVDFSERESGVLFVCDDHNVNRLYYCCKSANDIKDIITSLHQEELVLEFMTKDASENEAELSESGFEKIASMMRMTCRNCADYITNESVSGFFDPKVGTFPDTESAGKINKILWEVFDTRVSHLLSCEELEEAIRNRELTVHFNETGEPDAVLQVQIMPKRFYINQIYNGTEKRIIHAMLQNRLQEYINAGGKYIYAWVDRNNTASVKFHEKYCMQPDGMWNMVYSYKRKEL